MKKIILLAHDPGGYDVIYPVFQALKEMGQAISFYCIGPAALLNPDYAATELSAFTDINIEIQQKQILKLVTGTSWGNDFELRMISICKTHHIQTISIIDYWGNYLLRFRNQADEIIFSDQIIVMDELAYREAIEDGIPQQSLIVLGHPGLDYFIQQNKQTSKKIKGELYKILFLSQPLSRLYEDALGYTEQQAFADCLQLIEGKSDCVLHVKFHPKDALEFRNQFLSYEISGDLYELLPYYDLVIGMNTIGLLHSILLGNQTISYQPNLQKADACITNRLGLTEIVRSYEQLAITLDSFPLKELKQPLKEVNESLLWWDGHSTQRIVNFLAREVSINEH